MKTLCDLDKKKIEKSLNEIVVMVNHPKYICKKYDRAANKKDFVCKPVEIEL